MPLYSFGRIKKGKINIKEYVLIDPQGVHHTTTEGLIKFCEEHGLQPANLSKTLTGERKNNKGWRMESKNDNN